jgi:hypothetical protein
MALNFSTPRAVRVRVTAKDRRDQDVDILYEMANLFPRTTGLPMVVWVSPRGRAMHDARIKVCLVQGKMDIGQTAVVGIRPGPRLIEGDLAAAEFELVSQWIQANEAALLDFWNETIDSVELGSRLKKIWSSTAVTGKPLAIYVPPMANANHEYSQHVVPQVADDPVITDTVTP